jgi:PAS domain S-box-containing protein
MAGNTNTLWDNRFLNQIIDAMAEGVFTLDQNGQISSWNPAMEKISGFTAADALGRTCDILQFSRCFGKVCPENFKECGILKHGLTEAKECHLRHKDGREVPVIKNARLVRDENGNTIGVVETITDLTELKHARRRADEAVRRLGERHRFGNIIGKSPAMQEVFTAIRAAAASHAAILIQGESGTGKELVAGAIHFHSDRAEKPLITVNCSALTESLLESELFGHVKGAFTGALRDRTGRFEEADGGTVFLDEIGELSPFIQVKLLRVLQQQEVERVGESRRRKIDIRIITATHRDLYAMVREGRFREDLYYRLKVFPLWIPPLRSRREDIPLLTAHFIRMLNEKTGKRIRELSETVMRRFMDYPWPGNVRELENAVEHAFVLCQSGQVDLHHLPLEIRSATDPAAICRVPEPAPAPVRRIRPTRKALIELLNACGWNKAEVARRLGISRTAVWKYMKKWQIPLKGDGKAYR